MVFAKHRRFARRAHSRRARFAATLVGLLALAALNACTDSDDSANGSSDSPEADWADAGGASGGTALEGSGEDASTGLETGGRGAAGTGGTHSDQSSSAAGTGGTLPSGLVGDPGFPACARGPDRPSAFRAVEEADIVQMDGSHLYALSNLGGLSVVDVSSPDRPLALGTYSDARLGTPFEMHVRDGLVLAMFTGWPAYVPAEAETGWVEVQTNKLLAFDVTDPAHIELVGSFDVPGIVMGSRLAGHVLYVVSQLHGGCWGCEQGKALTSIRSFDLADPHQMREVDELLYVDAEDTPDQRSENLQRSSRSDTGRSIVMATECMYVARVEYGPVGVRNQYEPTSSSIQVVDISDPGGRMLEGAELSVEGIVRSAWQMDEHQGVLRVIAHPLDCPATSGPVVQTFEVTSSEQIEPLGRVELTLPRLESIIENARFDETRAYAYAATFTGGQLLTIDLSEPAQPEHRGAVEIPGRWVHMQPWGDRLLGLGADRGAGQGVIALSLVDVSDLSEPVVLDRVTFGSENSLLPEVPRGAQEVLQLLDDRALVSVLFLELQPGVPGIPPGSTAVQLVAFDREGLTLQGVLSPQGVSPRLVLQDTHVFAMGDYPLEVFDIGDPSDPKRIASVPIARYVTRMLTLNGDTVARISDIWYGRQPVDFANAAEIERPQSGLAELDLLEPLNLGSLMYPSPDEREALANGNRLFVTHQIHYGDEDGGELHRAELVAIDAADPSSPSVLSSTHWEHGHSWSRPEPGRYRIGSPGHATPEGAAYTGQAIAWREELHEYDSTNDEYRYSHRLRVIDISNPEQPHASVFELPKADRYGPLIAAGDLIVTSHRTGEADQPGVFDFFLDRIDVSTPGSFRQLPPMPIPGTVLVYDSGRSRALVEKLSPAETLQDTSLESCTQRFANYNFEENQPDELGSQGTCTGYVQQLQWLAIKDDQVTVLDSIDLPVDQTVRTYVEGDGVVFASVHAGEQQDLGGCSTWGCSYSISGGQPQELLVLGGLDDDAFEKRALAFDAMVPGWGGDHRPIGVHALGTRVLVESTGRMANNMPYYGMDYSTVVIVDASDPTHPVVERVEAVPGTVQHVAGTSDAFLLSLGGYGAQVLPITD